MNTFDRTVFSLCNEIDDLNWQLEELQRKYNKLEKDYSSVLSSSINHGTDMMGNLLKLTLAAGDEKFREAFAHD